jgi:hypothetical protein
MLNGEASYVNITLDIIVLNVIVLNVIVLNVVVPNAEWH